MDAVRRVEEARGCRVVDVSAQKCGWDLSSYPPAVGNYEGKMMNDEGKASQSFHHSSFITHTSPSVRHIEVKGRAQGASTVTITLNEILYALNHADKFLLAIVLVGENDTVDGPYYLRNPFDAEPGWGVSSVNFDLRELLERSMKYEV